MFRNDVIIRAIVKTVSKITEETWMGIVSVTLILVFMVAIAHCL